MRPVSFMTFLDTDGPLTRLLVVGKVEHSETGLKPSKSRAEKRIIGETFPPSPSTMYNMLTFSLDL